MASPVFIPCWVHCDQGIFQRGLSDLLHLPVWHLLHHPMPVESPASPGHLAAVGADSSCVRGAWALSGASFFQMEQKFFLHRSGPLLTFQIYRLLCTQSRCHQLSQIAGLVLARSSVGCHIITVHLILAVVRHFEQAKVRWSD